MNTKVIITGASGFIGKNLLIQLQNTEILAVVRRKDALKEIESETTTKNIEVLEINDLTKQSCLQALIERFDRDTKIVHLAWEATPGIYHSSPKNFRWAEATRFLAISAKNAKCKAFISAGTCAEYKPANRPLRATDELEPNTLYSLSKALTFSNLKYIFNESSTSFAWLRFFHLYGRFEPDGRLVPNILNGIKKNRPILLSKCDQVRDYLNVVTAVAKIQTVLQEDLVGCFNICSGEPRVLQDFIKEDIVSPAYHHLLEFGERKLNDFDPPYLVGQNDLVLKNT